MKVTSDAPAILEVGPDNIHITGLTGRQEFTDLSDLVKRVVDAQAKTDKLLHELRTQVRSMKHNK